MRWERITLAAAILLTGTSAFAEIAGSFLRKKEEPKVLALPKEKPWYCMPMEESWVSYNAWINFLYWQPLEDNIEPAGFKENVTDIGFSGPTNSGFVVNMGTNFKPGFQMGFGTNLDYGEVDLSAEYTRFYSTNHQEASNNQYIPMQLDPGTLFTFLNGITNATGGIGLAAPFSYDETWDLKMNIADLELGSWSHKRKFIETHPFVGLRGAWIDQTLDVEYVANFVNSGEQVGTTGAMVKTKSWAIGPRGGIATNVKLGKGFKFYAVGAGDLLYTNYKWHGQSFALVPSAGLSDVGPVNWKSDSTQSNISTLRSHFDLDLGFRWGICFNDRKSRFEFSAGYEMQVFFDQNMFRHFTTMIEEIGILAAPSVETELIGVVSTPISTEPDGNLYLQGLKVSADFTF